MVAGCALGATSGWNFGNLGGIASELADAYGVGLATIGLLTTAMVMTHLAIQIPGGKASDRFGPARPAPSRSPCSAPETPWRSRRRSRGWPWRRARSWALAPASPSSPAARSCASRVAGPLGQGVFGGLSLAPGGLALAVVPQLEEALGWRAPYWTSLGLALLALAAVFVLARPRPAGRGPPAVARACVRDRGLHSLAVLYAASYGLGVVLANWVVELLQRHGDMSDGAAAAVGALTLLLVVVSRPLGGWILLVRPAPNARGGVRRAWWPGPPERLRSSAVGPAWLAVLGAVLVGLAAGIPFSPAFTGAAATRPDAPAAAVGFVNAAANLVVLVGTPLVGLGFSLPGDGRLGFAVLALLWGAALAALPSQVALGVRTAASP